MNSTSNLILLTLSFMTGYEYRNSLNESQMESVSPDFLELKSMFGVVPCSSITDQCLLNNSWGEIETGICVLNPEDSYLRFNDSVFNETYITFEGQLIYSCDLSRDTNPEKVCICQCNMITTKNCSCWQMKKNLVYICKNQQQLTTTEYTIFTFITIIIFAIMIFIFFKLVKLFFFIFKCIKSKITRRFFAKARIV